MKILAIHAEYRIRGGEDVSHAAETAYLAANGYDVVNLVVKNDELAQRSKVAQATSLLHNPSTSLLVKTAIAQHGPDIVYVNNTFPSFPPDIFRLARRNGIPTVHVLRNYRQGCIAASTFRDNNSCTKCVGRSDLYGVLHACYENSTAASGVIALSRATNRIRGLADAGSAYIAVSGYVRDVAIASGLRPDRVAVRHNLVWPVPQAEAGRVQSEIPTLLFVGRDMPEKGLQQLIAAVLRLRQRTEVHLNIVGDAIGESTNTITYMGRLTSDEVHRQMSTARAVVVPSVWPEPFGRVVVESLAAGTPVIVSRVGGMTEMEGPGVRGFDMDKVGSLDAVLLEAVCGTPEIVEVGRVDARRRFEEDFSPASWMRLTDSVFSSVVYTGSENE